MEDQTIVSLLLSRAEEAIAALAEKYGKRLYSLAMNILGQHQDAEETVNDTYLEVWNSVPPKQPDPLSGFVFRIGRTTALDRFRHNLAQKRNSTYDVPLEELEACIPSKALEEQVEVRELGRMINHFLDTQSKGNRILFVRRYWFGDSVEDIARELGIRPNTASARLLRIRNQLRQHLMREGYYDE